MLIHHISKRSHRTAGYHQFEIYKKEAFLPAPSNCDALFIFGEYYLMIRIEASKDFNDMAKEILPV